MPCTILLVEDNEDVREMARVVLEENGNSVACAANGKEALTWLEAHDSPCLIVLDLMMPVMNGWQFLNELRAHPQWADIPVVITSATDQATAPLKAQAFLTKPLDVDELQRVTRQCRQHEAIGR